MIAPVRLSLRDLFAEQARQLGDVRRDAPRYFIKGGLRLPWGPLGMGERALRSVVMAIAFTGTLSACSSIINQFDPGAAAQRNYDKALADYQNCYVATRSVDACEKEAQMLAASTKVLASTLPSSGSR